MKLAIAASELQEVNKWEGITVQQSALVEGFRHTTPPRTTQHTELYLHKPQCAYPSIIVMDPTGGASIGPNIMATNSWPALPQAPPVSPWDPWPAQVLAAPAPAPQMVPWPTPEVVDLTNNDKD
jgi:hypothetical protein